MTITKQWDRPYGQFLPTGTTPKTADQNNTATAVSGGISKYTTLRLRTDIELYVIAGGGSTDVDLSFAYETLIAVGALATVGGSVTNSPTPLTDATLPSFIGSLGDWGQWEYLYPDIQFVNVNVPQLVVVTWRPRMGTIDTQFRRQSNTINGIDLWMPWEIQDGSGLINTTDAGGNTYYLGARFAQSWLFEYST